MENYTMRSKPRVVRIHTLKPGDRFSFIPAAWHGPGVVTESYGTRVLLPLGIYYQDSYPLSRDGKHRVSGTWTIKFDNGKVVNPPGVTYDHPERKVRLLGGKRGTIKR